MDTYVKQDSFLEESKQICGASFFRGHFFSHRIVNNFYCSVDFALYLTQHSPLVDNTFDL